VNINRESRRRRFRRGPNINCDLADPRRHITGILLKLQLFYKILYRIPSHITRLVHLGIQQMLRF